MIDVDKEGRLIGTVALALAIVTATYIAAHSWEHVRTRPKDRTLTVTGSAKKRITSDLIEWSATVTSHDMDRTRAVHELHEEVSKAHAYLIDKGIKEDSIEVSSVRVQEQSDYEYQGTGPDRIQRRIFKGYQVTQFVTVRSNDVARVEKVSRQSTDLLEQGVSITSSPPSYYYTKLGALKIEMLAAASRDARTRADSIVKNAGGGSIGKLVGADMGVININPPNSTATSWEGNNDTTSLEKDIITIVHVKYALR